MALKRSIDPGMLSARLATESMPQPAKREEVIKVMRASLLGLMGRGGGWIYGALRRRVILPSLPKGC